MNLEEVLQNLTQDEKRDKEYLISNYNKFVSTCEDRTSIGKYIELLLKHLNEQEKKEFFRIVNRGIDQITIKLDECIGKQQWQEVVDIVNENICKVQMPRNINGRVQYQHPNPLNAIAYSLRHNGEKVDVINCTEYMMLNKKIIALIKLKKYQLAQECIDLCEKIAPDNFSNQFQRLEILKESGQKDEILPFLNGLIDKVWHNTSFAYLLKEYAQFYENIKDYTTSICYYFLSLLYDNLDSEITQQKIDELSKKATQKIQLNKVAVEKYLREKNLKFEVSKSSAILAYEIYDCVFSDKDFDETIKQQAKQNLIGLYAGATEIAEMIEVKHSTPNRLMINYDYGFCVQVDKNFVCQDNSDDSVYRKHYTGKEFSFDFEIQKDTATLSLQEAILDRYEKIVQEKTPQEYYSTELINGQTVLIIHDKKGESEYCEYYFRVRHNVVAKIVVSGTSTFDDSKILAMVQTIKFLGEKDDLMQTELYKICILAKSMSLMEKGDVDDTKKYISRTINQFAIYVLGKVDMPQNLIIAGQNLIKLILLSLINQKASIEAFRFDVLKSIFNISTDKNVARVIANINSFVDTKGKTEYSLYADFDNLDNDNKCQVLEQIYNNIA